MAKWIWYYGEFEIYHNLKVHSMREEHEICYPPLWNFNTVYPIIEFKKEFFSENGGSFKVFAYGNGYVSVDGEKSAFNKKIKYKLGKHTVIVRVINYEGFPCIFACGKEIFTDETWKAYYSKLNGEYVGTNSLYCHKTDNPHNYIFTYKRVNPEMKIQNKRIILDFKKEIFGKLVVKNLNPNKITKIFYGESIDEALSDEDKCCVWEKISQKKEYILKPRAFRYVCIRGDTKNISVYALSEKTELCESGDFKCNSRIANDIRKMCVNSFMLCSREFFLDGIKRDRWVWAGDVRQSGLISNYVFLGKDIWRRSLIALLPKNNPVTHINEINDYSLLTIISLWEYYFYFKDEFFLKFIYERAEILFDFICSRLDENHFVCEKEGDWIFIDWADMDKSGPLCAEQILLWQAVICMKKISDAVDKSDVKYSNLTETLKKTINEKFWDDNEKAFVDCCDTKRKNISRQSNILALIFDFADEEQKISIVNNVLKNDKIPQIKTPYFKFYEIMALCKTKNQDIAKKSIEEYWGSMVQKGATSAWEQYDIKESVPDCYKMYNGAYQKSLCHAWSCGPIYFYGKYCMGVYPTKPGYQEYIVSPSLELYKSYYGTVPTQRGNIYVKLKDKVITVLSAIDGGVLKIGEQKWSIKKSKPIVIDCNNQIPTLK